MTKLTIIIVSYNTKDLLVKCLKSIENSETEKDLKLKIVVVDNNSQDGSVQAVKKSYPEVALVEGKENLGFSRANNIAFKLFESDYYLLLNSDTELKKDSIKQLIEFAETNPGVGIVGPRLLNTDGSIQSSVFKLPTFLGAFKEYFLLIKGSFEKYAPKTENPLEVEAVVGAAMLIHKEVTKKIGFLDERYFMYFEDLDYCRKARTAGFKIYYLPTAEVKHYHGASGKGSSQTYKYLVESSKIYHGTLNYLILSSVLWLGTKWQTIKTTIK